MTGDAHDPWANVAANPDAAAGNPAGHDGFGEWCILELMGRRQLAGYVTPAQFPAGFVRIEIPADGPDPAATQIYNPDAVYGMHPVTEALARAASARFRHAPISRYDLPAAPVRLPDRDMDDGEDPY